VNLRRQLLIVSLLLLSLPWAGCQFVREMEGALRTGQEQSLQATAQAISAVLRDKPTLLYPNEDRLLTRADSRPLIYARPYQEPIFVDGYDDGWEEVEARELVSAVGDKPLRVRFRALTRGGQLYLLLEVQDHKVIYHNPAVSREPNGDHLILRTWLNNRRQDYAIATAAPGEVRGRYASPIDPGTNARRIRGQWQDSEKGYTLELQMPLADTGGRLGFYVVNALGKPGEKVEVLGNIEPLEQRAPPWLIYTPEPLQASMAPFAQGGRHIEVIDSYRWQIADSDLIADNGEGSDQPNSETFWLLRLLYRSILTQEELEPRNKAEGPGMTAGSEVDRALGGEAINQRYRDAQYATRTVLTAAAPIYNGAEVMGAVRISQSSEQYLSLTDQAFTRLLGYSLIAIVLGVAGLLGYAGLLSWRIRNLAEAANRVAHKDGISLENFPRSRAPDELGDLSRSYAALLGKLQQYNEYLRTLSRKLSHELRTPIAVIQTSLENLEQQSEPAEQNKVYLDRARGGLVRLGKILNAMSEANGLEESIRSNQKQNLDLVPLLNEVFEAYKTVFTQHELQLDCQCEEACTIASPELLVQALDKLMDNAASFCPEGGRITLQLNEEQASWAVTVLNEGPPLPQSMQGQLFGSMVSIRDDDSEDIHLGLGLHIVQLIADFHDAEVTIGNNPDSPGVFCSIFLPRET